MNPLLFPVIGKVIETVANFIDPAKKAEAELAILKLQQDAAFKEIDTALAYSQAQTNINAVEAANPNVFVSGWRPATGWVCVVGLAYQWLIVPLSAFAYTLYTGHALPVTPPEMDPNILFLIGSILGVNIVTRGVEKIKGKA